MRHQRIIFTGLVLTLPWFPAAAQTTLDLDTSAHPRTAAYKWLDVALEATAREVDRHGARPTINSRNLAIVLTAMYDAWACYDERSVGTRLGGSLRRPPRERTIDNKGKAIA